MIVFVTLGLIVVALYVLTATGMWMLAMYDFQRSIKAMERQVRAQNMALDEALNKEIK